MGVSVLLGVGFVVLFLVMRGGSGTTSPETGPAAGVEQSAGKLEPSGAPTALATPTAPPSTTLDTPASSES